jgi:hypothetical protein
MPLFLYQLRCTFCAVPKRCTLWFLVHCNLNASMAQRTLLLTYLGRAATLLGDVQGQKVIVLSLSQSRGLA